MSKPIIEIKNIGKKYSIAHQRGGYVALRDVLTGIIKKPFSFLKNKAKQAVGLAKKEDFWALKDVSLTVEKGEVIGVIGHNGAGKSTLLKILSQITPPTEGEIILRGRVGSLLEVGTGFHPELTGRENIFLNGAILGMRKREIEKRFDEIVAFAGIDKFLDTPVKYYSSGMHVRLAFSVAAHMEPEILLVDEVLAVGDAEFQKKCLGKMDEITKKDGRTILFVSHNIAAVQSLCTRTILLEKGKLLSFGPTESVVKDYLAVATRADLSSSKHLQRRGDGRLSVKEVYLTDANSNKTNQTVSGEETTICIEYEKRDNNLKEIDLTVGLDSVVNQNRVAIISNKLIQKNILVNDVGGKIKIKIKNNPLNSGDYLCTLFLEKAGVPLDWIMGALRLTVLPGNFYLSGQMPQQGNVLLDYEIESF